MIPINIRQLIETVAIHLSRQQAVSRDDEGCWYRNWNGQACAIGCLIRDDNYTQEIEGSTVHSLSLNYQGKGDLAKVAEDVYRFKGDVDQVRYERFLRHMQIYHDDAIWALPGQPGYSSRLSATNLMRSATLGNIRADLEQIWNHTGRH